MSGGGRRAGVLVHGGQAGQGARARTRRKVVSRRLGAVTARARHAAEAGKRDLYNTLMARAEALLAELKELE